MPSSPLPARLLLQPTVSLGVRVLESMSGQAMGSARTSGAVRHARRATPASLLATPRLQQITTSLHQYRLRIALATSLAATWIHLINQSPLLCTGTSSPLLQSDGKRADRVGGVLLHAQTRKRSAPSARRSGTRGQSTSTQTSSRARSSAEGNTEDAKRGQGQGSGGNGDSASKLSTQTRKISDVSDIGELMRHPDLMKDIKTPRNPIVLCHGLYGFDVRGPFWGLEIHYWASILDILRKKVGAEVIVRGVPGTGAVADRAEELHKFLCSADSGVRGRSINFVGHSMGGLDARHIISVIKPKPEEYRPVSLTTLSTPHRGSPFMDWCNANVGTGNDRVEAEIREARKRLASKGMSTHQMQEASRAAHDDVKKVPFSLKTPLFVRPSKGGAGQSEGVVDNVNKAADEETSKVTEHGTSPDSTASNGTGAGSPPDPSTKAEEAGGKKTSSSSLLNFSAFNKALSSIGGSFSAYMLGVLDQPAYAMLSTRYMSQVFNPTVPNSPDVAYFSVASRKRSLPIWHPLWLPKLVLDAAAESRSAGGERDGSGDALGSDMQGNDGLVSVESAKWGTFLGVMEGCDHWDLRGGGAPRWRGRINPTTGKPWPVEEKEKEREQEMEKEKEKKSDKSWIDINTILGKLLNRNAPDGKDKDKAGTQKQSGQGAQQAGMEKSSTAPEKVGQGGSSSEDEGMLDEVATWISDRLPRGDETRRAEAEKIADEQDRKSHSYQTAAAESGKPAKEEQSREVEEGAKAKQSSKSIKLRREAAWQEELGHENASRDLRRELAWHRSEWDRSSAANQSISNPPAKRELDWDRHLKQKAEQGEGKKADEANELERFWVAICRHLWSHGY